MLCPTRELAMQIHRMFLLVAHSKKFKIVVLSKANANDNAFGPDAIKK